MKSRPIALRPFLPVALFVLFPLFMSNSAAQKRVYIPEDLRGMDMQSDTAQWSFKRSAQTDDVVFFWERGFGDNLQDPPSLEGHDMRFSLPTLMRRVQSFYSFFRDTLGFVVTDRPGTAGPAPRTSKADRYKMMVMVQYSLDGTAYGGTYDNFIGALWVAPNRIQDSTMNCMAHELGHSFQLQIPADSVGEAWGGSGFYEMTSQWMLWQVNPWWLRDENYHFEAFKKLTHKAYLHTENIYHSPYVIQWWADLHGRKSIAELYRQGRRGEDPVMTYQRLYHLNQQAFCDEMLRGYLHLVNFDFSHARLETRPYACTFLTELDTLAAAPADAPWYRPRQVPESYGFNAIRLSPGQLARACRAGSVSLRLRGDNLRWGFVAVTTDGESIYSDVDATTFRLPRGKRLACLYLVVMGAPLRHHPSTIFGADGGDAAETFPYQFQLTFP